jgi:hypothetical protein
MSKILLVSVCALAVAAVGCSGNTNDGGAGHGGTAGATGGSGGSGAGSDGSTAGSGGGAGSAGYIEDAGIDPPACGTDVFSPTMFCTVLLAFCGNGTMGYTNMAECRATYSALGTSNPFRQQCQSYHLCNAANDTGSDRILHCSHGVGQGLCAF